MDLNLLLSALTNLIVVLIIAKIIDNSFKIKNYKIAEFFSVLGLFYLSSFIISILYAFKSVQANFVEVMVFGTSFITIITPLIIFGVYAITRKKIHLSLMIVYALIIFLTLKEVDSLIILIHLISYSVLILLLINLLRNSFFMKTAFYGIFYSFSSIILIFLMMARNISGYWFLPNIFLMLSYYYLIPISYEDFSKAEKKEKKISFSLLILKYSAFITALLFFSFLSTIAVHEIGHAVVAKFYKCQAESVIYSRGLTPYTEITCLNNEKPALLILGGLLFTIIFSVTLMLFGTELIVYLGYLLLGISFLIANSDLSTLGMPRSILITTNIFAVFVILIGMFRISRMYIETLGESSEEGNKNESKNKKKVN
ncbi:MAG: hypothetical protein ACP5OZ_02825 [Candidatus Woesearchaeota archaeon]